MVEFLNRYKTHAAALMFAIIVWLLVVTENYFEYRVRAPLRLNNLPHNSVVSNNIPHFAFVKIRGRGKSILRLLLFNDIRINIDLDQKLGKRIIKMKESDVVVGKPNDITVVGLMPPDTMTVVIEPLVSKLVPVESNVSIKVKAGYTLIGAIHFRPDSVRIEGPENAVSRLDSIRTDSIILKNVKHPIEQEIHLLRPADPRIRLINSKSTMMADVQMLMEKPIDGILVQARNIPNGMKAIVMPSHLALVIEGGVKIVTQLTKDDIVAYVDLKKVWKSSHDIPAYIETPNGIRYRDVSPERFKVVLEKK